jgi:diphosphomevalonate decarboxylase
MKTLSATAISHPNIAFIKYWGNRDNALRLPVNGSISMNLDGLFTRTKVSYDEFLSSDELIINGKPAGGIALRRVSQILDEVRVHARMNHFARVASENNFPSGAGIASSASAFAALSLAASKAAGLDLSERELSILARHGSGSASRSIPGGFVEWKVGTGDKDSFAESIAPANHWALVDCIAVVNATHKETGSTEGHALAPTSPLQAARVADAPRRLDLCRRAILEKDFSALAEIVELDSDMMHAVMMTSSPALHYWQAPSVAVMESVRRWRKDGASAFYTVDAGANVHVLCPEIEADEIASRLRKIDDVKDVLKARAGGRAKLVEE